MQSRVDQNVEQDVDHNVAQNVDHNVEAGVDMEVDFFTESPQGCVVWMKSTEQVNIFELTKPLRCGTGFIPVGFRWNGASVNPLIRGLFPRWKHPIASCRHDFRCGLAQRHKALRKRADVLFKQDTGVKGNKFEQVIGYWGVRCGAFFGIGS